MNVHSKIKVIENEMQALRERREAYVGKMMDRMEFARFAALERKISGLHQQRVRLLQGKCN